MPRPVGSVSLGRTQARQISSRERDACAPETPWSVKVRSQPTCAKGDGLGFALRREQLRGWRRSSGSRRAEEVLGVRIAEPERVERALCPCLPARITV